MALLAPVVFHSKQIKGGDVRIVLEAFGQPKDFFWNTSLVESTNTPRKKIELSGDVLPPKRGFIQILQKKNNEKSNGESK
jgi:hypothetical protein